MAVDRRGFVHIKLLGNMPSGSTTHDEARRAAGYLSKYVAKTFDQPVRELGGHRYDLAQGFQPAKERITGATTEEVRALAIGQFGAPPSYEWRSWEDERWAGPSAVFFQWH